MATLTETAYYTRKIIKFGSIGLVAFLILRFLVVTIYTTWRAKNPPPPPPPTIVFGKMPDLQFPSRETPPLASIKAETISGTLPEMDSVAKVYLTSKKAANLLALDRTKTMAKKMGFQGEPTVLSERVYRFSGQNSSSTLEIDIISQNFKLLYDYAHDPEIFAEKKLPTDDQAISEAKAFLRQADLLSNDLTNGQAKVTYWRFVAPNIVPAISLSEADLVRVDLFRADLDNWKVLPPSAHQALVSFLFSGSRTTGKRIVEVQYSHLPVSTDKFATYPLKRTTDAWQELLDGKGYIADIGDNPNGVIVVRKIYLAYYEAETIQDFLQPIFVFEGDKDFVAYVPAVDNEKIRAQSRGL